MNKTTTATNVRLVNVALETFFLGCIVLGVSRIHADSDDIPWEKPQKSVILHTDGRNTRIMMDFCLFSQGMSSEFA